MILRVVLTGIVLLLGAAPGWAEGEAHAPYVTPAEVKAWQEGGKAIFFLDVREADEFEAGHLPGGEEHRLDRGRFFHSPATYRPADCRLLHLGS